MKVLLVNTFDTFGGAAIAANRLHHGLLNMNFDSNYLVAKKKSHGQKITPTNNGIYMIWSKISPFLDCLPLKIYPQKEKSFFSVSWLPSSTVSKINDMDADLVHLHWFGNGFISIENIAKIKKPIVWTLHDMWAFSGGCHYTSDGCTQFQSRLAGIVRN